MRLLVASMISWVLAWSSTAKAIDSTGISERFGLVGVISDDAANGKTPGVAVLKDKQNGITMTLKSGDSIPYEATLKIKSVRRNQVLITDGKSTAPVSYFGSFDHAPDKVAAVEEKPAASERLLDFPEPLFTKELPLVGSDNERARDRNEDVDRPRFVAPGWIETNSTKATSEYLPLEEINEENFEFE